MWEMRLEIETIPYVGDCCYDESVGLWVMAAKLNFFPNQKILMSHDHRGTNLIKLANGYYLSKILY